MSLNQEILRALGALIGLPLWAAGRAADLFWFQFGDRNTRLYHGGHMGHVGTYALHVTCPWRLSNVEGIVTGNADLWVTGDPNTTAAEIALDQKPGKALVDVNLRAWQEMHAAAPLRGESVRADHCGGSVLDLEHKFALEVFPEASHTAHNETEVWRLLQPNQSTAHFVVLNTGIEPPE